MLVHLRKNAVAYVALAVAMTSTSAYAASAIGNGSVTTKKLHHNAVTSAKIRNHSIKLRDLNPVKGMDYLQSAMTGDNPVANPELINVAPYDFTLPRGGKAYVSVFLPSLSGNCAGTAQPFIGLYIDNVPIPTTRQLVPLAANARAIQIGVTLPLRKGAHAARLGITCNGQGTPSNVDAPGAKNWTVGLIGT